MAGISELDVCLELCEYYLPKYRWHYKECVEGCRTKYGKGKKG